MSVIKPGKIRKKAAINKQKPPTISPSGFLLIRKLLSADRKVAIPWSLAKYKPTTAVRIVKDIVLKAPITEPTLIIK